MMVKAIASNGTICPRSVEARDRGNGNETHD